MELDKVINLIQINPDMSSNLLFKLLFDILVYLLCTFLCFFLLGRLFLLITVSLFVDKEELRRVLVCLSLRSLKVDLAVSIGPLLFLASTVGSEREDAAL